MDINPPYSEWRVFRVKSILKPPMTGKNPLKIVHIPMKSGKFLFHGKADRSA